MVVLVFSVLTHKVCLLLSVFPDLCCQKSHVNDLTEDSLPDCCLSVRVPLARVFINTLFYET